MGGKAPKVKTSPSETAMADIAKRQDLRSQMLEKTYLDPLMQQQFPMIQEALATNPFRTTLSAADRAPIEGQYNQARQSLMNTAIPGGQLRRSMQGLERDRAQSIASAANQARQLGIGRALQLSSGTMPTMASTTGLEQSAMSGLGNAAQMFNQRQQSQQQAGAQSAAGWGSLAGGALGSIWGPIGTGLGSMAGGMLGKLFQK
jgi:hypothetical protein